jgi:hypothetical protein
MQAVTIAEITERLRKLPAEKLASVYDFVSFLSERTLATRTLELMVASEAVLGRDWNRPEEDAAWASL